MKTTELAQLEARWMARQHDIASAWFTLVRGLSPVSVDREATLPRLEEFTTVLIEQLVAETFQPESLRKIGQSLEANDNMQSEAILKIHDFLAEQLTAGFSPDDIARIHPRLSQLLAALIAGFFLGKAERAKQFDMSAMSKMGHDLKTPINAVTGFSRVILKGIDGPITEFQQQDLTSIHEAGQKLLTMLNDLFEVAKADAARTNIYTRPFEVIDLLSDVLRTAQPILARKGHALSVKGTADLGTISGGASEARWILLSLLLYTGRYFENGTLSLSANRRKVDGVERVFFEVQGVLPEGTEFPLPESESGEAEEVGLIVSKQFCKDMGGGYTLIKEGNVVTGSLWLPARIPALDTAA